ncbi:Crp/Fnr family transcriptional regulator [Candidatus Mycolicibacterium alkanivorans]|uniref:Crp/Fnr family transcriptional regulator n=1 Tax=Candidatus Mycolicibacterium alkanivorans TaxID=2954114 RepID=A0ABS9Z199_9MYCO|nr:Crp/Fnr family transcriptional regulator [Candidatus Mycolicibacterium alkanivorans]MCI4676743.1 Crp/Fnr family transcriptional regulator [Candidatus Mycolicibacterium alkanivorans]
MNGDVRQAIASAPMFGGLDGAHVDFLAAESRSIFLPAGQVLFRRGTPSTGFYIVREGRMQLSVSNSEGLVKVLEILSPGSAFGHAVMFLREPYPVDATALADTDLVFVPVGAVDRVLDEDPSMARIMLASMAKRLQSKVQDIAMLSLQSATQRIVAFVLGAVGAGSYHLDGEASSVTDAAPVAPQASSIELPALKHVLASRLGMTPETFSRAMRTLTSAGLVSVDGSVLRVPDVAALDAYSRDQSIV